LIGNSRRQPEVLGLLMSHTMVIILLSVLHLCGSEYGSTDEIFFVTLDNASASTKAVGKQRPSMFFLLASWLCLTLRTIESLTFVNYI